MVGTENACNVDFYVFFIVNRLDNLLRTIEFQVAWDNMALTWYVIVLNGSGLGVTVDGAYWLLIAQNQWKRV